MVTPEDIDPRATLQLQIVDALTEKSGAMRPQAIAEAIGESPENVRNALTRMRRAGLLVQPRYGLYKLANRSDLNATQEKSHTPSIQSDIGLSPTSHDNVSDKSNPVKGKVPMELYHKAGFVGSPICEYVDVFLGGQCVATIQHHRVEPGTRKRLDITDEALWQRYAPQIPEHKEEPPENG